MPLAGLANTGGQVVSMFVAGSGTLGAFTGAFNTVAGTLSGSNIHFAYDFTDGDYITFGIPYVYTGGTRMFWLRANNGTYTDA